MKSVPKPKWSSFCDRVTDALTGLRAEIEVASLDLGDQVQAKSLPVLGIAYDHKNDVFEVALEGLDHLIRRPESLMVIDGPTGVTSMLVVDWDAVRHVVRFKEPLMLPAPEGEQERSAT